MTQYTTAEADRQAEGAKQVNVTDLLRLKQANPVKDDALPGYTVFRANIALNADLVDAIRNAYPDAKFSHPRPPIPGGGVALSGDYEQFPADEIAQSLGIENLEAASARRL